MGAALAARPAIARRIVADGHALGNHTWSHADLTRLSAAQFAAEVSRTQAAIRRIAGSPARWLRPPYGAVDSRTRALAAAHALRLALWDVDPQDWRRPGTGHIVEDVLEDVRPGAVVLLHDGGGDRAQTVAALEYLLRTLRARGYVFRALP